MKDVTVLKNGKVVRIITTEQSAVIHVLTPELTHLNTDPNERWAYIDTMENPTLRRLNQLLHLMGRCGPTGLAEPTFNPVCSISQSGLSPCEYRVKCSDDCLYDEHHEAYVTAVIEHRVVVTPEFMITPIAQDIRAEIKTPIGFMGRDYRHTKTGKIYLCIGLAFNVGTDMWDIVYAEKGLIGPVFSQSIARFSQRVGGKPRFTEVEE